MSRFKPNKPAFLSLTLIDINALITGTVLSAPGAGEFLAEEVPRRLGDVRRDETVVRVPVVGLERLRVGDVAFERAVLIRDFEAVVVGFGTALRRPGDPERLTGLDCE